jgi:3-hydroxybutyryl-CoA dehydratase
MDETNLNIKNTLFAEKALPVLTKLVTQEMINNWAEVSGDFNPLHVDPSFGKATFFKTNIAHGPLTLSFVIEMLTRWLGKYWISGGRLYDVKLISPVPPGTKISVGGKVRNTEDEGDKRKIYCDIFVRNQDDKLIITGKASCRI